MQAVIEALYVMTSGCSHSAGIFARNRSAAIQLLVRPYWLILCVYQRSDAIGDVNEIVRFLYWGYM